MYWKKIFASIVFSFTLSASIAQVAPSYEKQWKHIDSLIDQRGLPASALVEVNKLYAQAKKEGNNAQLIKALIYRMNLATIKEEDATQKNINSLEQEINSAQQPAKSILQSLLATQYWNYFQQQRWRLYSRTTTINFKKDDIATWGVSDFHKAISALYLSSISNEKLLQQTKLEPFDPVILKGNVRYLRPTLYDLLAHTALNYFTNDEIDVDRPVYAFEIADTTVFAPAAFFIRQPFTTPDSLSLHHKALKVFQQLISFHIKDAHPAALIDIDLERLEFVQRFATVSNSDERYRAALEQIGSQYGNDTNAATAWYRLASWYAAKAAAYNRETDTSNRFGYAKALAICEQVLAQKSRTEGYTACYNLKQEILGRALNLESEKVNLPGQPFRVLVSYKNLSKIFVRVVRLDSKMKESFSFENWEENNWKKIVQLPVTTSSSFSLPDPQDYQQHSVEIKADALPVGDYAVIAGTTSDFKADGKDPMALQFFAVSNLSYINSNNDYFVLHRQTGEPIPDARVQLGHRANNGKLVKGETLRPDKSGHFTVNPSQNNRYEQLRIELTTADDHLLPEEMMYAINSSDISAKGPENIPATFLFTDRAIYRPGQTVYFKGIMVNKQREANINTILASQKTTIYLIGVGGQSGIRFRNGYTPSGGAKLDSLVVTTNSFGSYSGKFTLPSNTLNGRFLIQDGYTNYSQGFSVEEYKRPKFFVELAKPAATYKLGDSLKVVGTAKAYAGNDVDGARVSYRVTRRTIMLLYGFAKYIWPPHSQQQVEIAHGIAATDSKGSFTIPFQLLPDNNIAKKDQPVFYYEINADVTDINGETRSASTTIAASWQSLRLNISLPEKISADSLRNITVSSTNLEDVFQPSNVTLTVQQLKTPDRIFRPRSWEKPDQFIMDQQEYYRLFPHDMYNDETDITKWEKLQQVFSVTDSTAKDRPFRLNERLKAGWYVVEATAKDRNGEQVRDRKYIQVYDRSTIPGPLPVLNIESSSAIWQPGEKGTYTIRTNLGKLFVIHDIAGREEKPRRSFVTVNGSASLDLTVTEKDLGGLNLMAITVKDNRVYREQITMQVPYTSKELHISYTSFRDKTLPGSKEKWSVNILGSKGDKVAAEILTSMYDASLDEFAPHEWDPLPLWQPSARYIPWNESACFGSLSGLSIYMEDHTLAYEKNYDALLSPTGQRINIRGLSIEKREEMTKFAPPRVLKDEDQMSQNGVSGMAPGRALDSTGFSPAPTPPPIAPNQTTPSLRTNFNETAFFFPDLHTDSLGNISFSFTMPEALTQWKWMLLAHTRELAFGLGEKTIITQKQLMVQPNAPRFLREGDRMDFSGKIVNMTDHELTGQVELQFVDPTTHQSIDGWFRNMFPNQYFTVGAHESVPVSFTIEVPFQYNRPAIYRLIARSDSLSDGEENILPVLSNRMLVTETLPLPVKSGGTHHFNFEKLAKSGSSETLEQRSLTIEFTANPAWNAVQALPYLMEYPYECAEQVFNRFYANAIASHITQSIPGLKSVFEKWKTTDTSALMSNLQKNEELKNILLEETPWVLQAGSETEQKKHIAALFDMVRMSQQLSSALQQLKKAQLEDGSFPWFHGGLPDRYITQYILAGLGHLQKLNALPEDRQLTRELTQAAIQYADRKLKDDYDYLVKHKAKLDNNNLGYTQIQYLYIRSFFNDYAVPGDVFTAYNYYRKQAQRFWLQQPNKYMQGMIALSLFRTGDVQTAKNIIASLKQHALISEEMGMYWKDITGGYYWHQLPIEAQSLLIEAFSEITNDVSSVNDMRTWLLKQKQVQHWPTTKATADACYALLLRGADLLASTPEVQVKLGDMTINSKDQQQEAGSGYFKKVIDGKEIVPAMGDIQVSLNTSSNEPRTAWGAVYWQYFESLENITPAATPLQLTKKLFIETNTDQGPVLQPVEQSTALHVGDKIKVRIELRADRDLEYVHMKDMRASCLEPVNVLSSHQWQGGLGYYETTKDASTSFFFNWLPKGTYVFEYPLFVTHTGTFSNGVTSIQCMYAPEFSSHSEGIKISVEEK